MIRAFDRELPALLRDMAGYVDERVSAELDTDQARAERTGEVAQWCRAEAARLEGLRTADRALGELIYQEVVTNPDHNDYADMGAHARRLIEQENPT